MHKHRWAAIWLFLGGAFAGTLLDAFQVYNRIERYPAPTIAGETWWVPLLLGGAALAIGYSHALADPLLWHRRPIRPLLGSLGEQSWLLLAYVITVLPLYSVSKLGLLLVIYLNFWLLVGRSWQNFVLSLVTAITGTLIEMTLVATGVFAYTQPDILGVPFWLPCLYAIASLAIGDLGRTIVSTYARGA